MMLWKNRNKKVGLCVMVVMASLVLAAVWAVLATPETALAKKPDNPGGGGGGDEPKALNGSATFRDVLGIPDPTQEDPDRVLYIPDAVQSDGGGPYYDSANGRKGDTILDLGDAFFRLVAKEKNGVGRRFVLDFTNLVVVDEFDQPIAPPFILDNFLPENPYVWSLHVQGTLQDWRDQDEGDPVPRDGNIYFGNNGSDEANVNYGSGSSGDGDQLTVIRTGPNQWTIESFATDKAEFFQASSGESFGFAPMPFKIDYDGTATP